jgi:hypothetical protein
VAAENVMEEGREAGTGTGKIWDGGVRGGVAIEVVRRKVGFLVMHRGEGRFMGWGVSMRSWESSDEAVDGRFGVQG